MLRRRNGQRGLWEVLRFEDLEPEKQMDPRLHRIDEVLKDDALVDAVLEAMRGCFPQSGRRGRHGTPAEVALRMLVLMHLKNWIYEQLEWEVKGNRCIGTSAESTRARFKPQRRWSASDNCSRVLRFAPFSSASFNSPWLGV